jgi:hypothetical protein
MHISAATPRAALVHGDGGGTGVCSRHPRRRSPPWASLSLASRVGWHAGGSDGGAEHCERPKSVVASWNLGAASKTARASTEAMAVARTKAHPRGVLKTPLEAVSIPRRGRHIQHGGGLARIAPGAMRDQGFGGVFVVKYPPLWKFRLSACLAASSGLPPKRPRRRARRSARSARRSARRWRRRLTQPSRAFPGSSGMMAFTP